MLVWEFLSFDSCVASSEFLSFDACVTCSAFLSFDPCVTCKAFLCDMQGVHGCHGRRERSVTQRMSRETGRMELHSSKRASSDGDDVGEQRGQRV